MAPSAIVEGGRSQRLDLPRFMKGGNLSHLIGKAVAAEAMFPSGALWNIFLLP